MTSEAILYKTKIKRNFHQNRFINGCGSFAKIPQSHIFLWDIIVYYSIGFTKSMLEFWRQIIKSVGGALLNSFKILMLVSLNQHCTKGCKKKKIYRHKNGDCSVNFYSTYMLHPSLEAEFIRFSDHTSKF